MERKMIKMDEKYDTEIKEDLVTITKTINTEIGPSKTSFSVPTDIMMEILNKILEKRLKEKYSVNWERNVKWK